MWLVMGRKASLSGVFKGAPSRQTKGTFRGQHGATGVLITERVFIASGNIRISVFELKAKHMQCHLIFTRIAHAASVNILTNLSNAWPEAANGIS